MVILRPDQNDYDKPATFKDMPILSNGFKKSADWGKLMNCSVAADLNDLVRNGEIRQLIRLNPLEFVDAERGGMIADNGEGKTNLIEAVYLSSIGKSFRTSRDNDLIRFGQEYAVVQVSAEKKYTDTRVEIIIKRGAGKNIRRDGSVIHRSSELLENIIVVVFSPEDLKIVKEEPEKRRKFIDRELSLIEPAYYSCLGNYKKALLQRNSYLKEDYIDESLLSLWDDSLIKYGSELMKMRKKFIQRINDISGRIHEEITGGKEKLTIEYDPNIPYDDDFENQSLIFAETLNRALPTDLKMRTTTKGPHKDDMNFFTGDINIRNYGSQGQQRTCALSLKLAELDFIREETGEEGILLLDDVMSELDEERRLFLIGALKENQLFITATDIDERLLENYPDAKVIRIEKGKRKE